MVVFGDVREIGDKGIIEEIVYIFVDCYRKEIIGIPGIGIFRL